MQLASILRRRAEARSTRVAVAVAALTLACSGEDSTVVVPIGPDGPETSLIAKAVLPVEANVRGLVIEVTAADFLEPLVFNIEVEPNTGDASGVIRVPAGSDRLVVGRAYNSDGVLTHEGEALLDVRPGRTDLLLTLLPVVGNLFIDLNIGSHSIQVTPVEATLNVGETLQMQAVVSDPDGNPADPVIGWGSTNPVVASVDANGLVTAHLVGEIQVVATVGNTAASASVYVQQGDGGLREEVCDDVDNDGDGTADEGLLYCFGGASAPNTDGAICLDGFYDIDGDPANGCESNTPTYSLTVYLTEVLPSQLTEGIESVIRVQADPFGDPFIEPFEGAGGAVIKLASSADPNATITLETTFVDNYTLTAVVPANVLAGIYDVWVYNPDFTAGLLPSALSIITLSDADGDGSPSNLDCDDGNDSIYPGAPELVDGIDNDCDGQVDEGLFSADQYEPNESFGGARSLLPMTAPEFRLISANFHDDVSDTSDFYRIRFDEGGSVCFPGTSQPHVLDLRLSKPNNEDYDLYLYDATGPVTAASTTRGGASEDIVLNLSGTCAFDDSWEFVIEVRRSEGSHVGGYDLRIQFTEN